jgi:hypothetical protein
MEEKINKFLEVSQQEIPKVVKDFIANGLDLIKNSLSFDLDFTSETLPFVDHYLKTINSEKDDIQFLVACGTGAYLGETMRQLWGGKWFVENENEPQTWQIRFVSAPLAINPVSIVYNVIKKDESVAIGAYLNVPPNSRELLQDAMDNTAMVSLDVYYSICGQFDGVQFALDFLSEIERIRAEKSKKDIKTYGDIDPLDIIVEKK